MEANAAINMGPGHGFRGGLLGMTQRFTLCTLAPYAASVACEACLRRAFLRRCQAVQVYVLSFGSFNNQIFKSSPY